ncbi:UNVERIFIED_CONTAM: hypothetical protein PYX00_000254 [Menopon gallinae]|uniref:CFAP61 dimerisation domain-containing protein n=1 Tax=Menopon gallinae TaxID=328185 RepID=A0AAW2I8H9_9NEOP
MNYQQPQGMTSSSSSSESVYELELPTLYVSSLSSLFASPMDTASTFSLPPSTFEGIESFNRKADMRYRLVNEPQQHHHHHHHHHDTDRRSLYSDPKASNAIYIELFEMDTEKIDERLSVDFLKAAFSLAPDREYCVITIPTDMYPFPLLNYFVKANHNHRKQLRHELYICHRSYIFNSSVLVRPAVSADGEELKQFLSYVVNGAKIFAEFKDTITPPVTEERCYCLIVNETIVGAAMLFRRPDLENLEFYFDIKEFTFVDIHGTENTSILKHLLISPPFQCFSRYFMMEVMRLADVTCLFHLSCQETRLSGNILAVLGELIPIKPRRTIKYRKNLEASKDIFSSLLNFESPFSLFMANFEVCSHVKLDLNRIIVVVGASLTAYSFFESVIFRSSRGFTLYNNLIWISEDAVELAPNEIRSSMFPLESKYTSDYCKMLSLRSHVHCICGVMTGINRSDKYIIINESHAVKYDILILTVGLQFQRPTPVYKAKMESCKRDKFIGSPYARFLKVGAPVEPENKFVDICNMFIVNNQLDAESLLATLDRVKQRIQSGVAKEKRVIIYGYNIRVFLMIHALLKFGIPPNMIAYFEPFPSRQASMSVFGDTAIDSQVIHIIENIGVQYYPKYFFYDWTLTSPHHIGSISFHSENRQITVPCLAFLPMVEKLVSDVNFHACNKAGLVYDGRLIIDKDFQTNDEHIFAAGPFTKYSRRYYAPGRNHQFYNSVEIGEKLAELVQMEIDPYFYKEKENECETMEDGCDDEDDLPTFKEPIMLYCQLPGDFYYFCVRKPGKEMEIETDYHFGNFGDVLSTGDCQMSRGYGYFKVHLDESGYVRNIVCFDNKEIDYARLYTLYGKHEKLLNNLLLRYDCSMVTNFYEYFREPWTDILSNPDFRFLYKYNRKIFYEEKMKNNKESMMDRIDNYLEQNEWKQLPSIQRRKIELLFQNSDLKSAIKKNLFELLEYLKKELPGFSPSAIVANVIDRSAGMEGLNHPGGFS